MGKERIGEDMNLQEDGQTEEKTAILIVDDNEINRMILSETFRDQDKILEAENGKEALDLIGGNRVESQRFCWTL